jgi:hypothetical protein
MPNTHSLEGFVGRQATDIQAAWLARFARGRCRAETVGAIIAQWTGTWMTKIAPTKMPEHWPPLLNFGSFTATAQDVQIRPIQTVLYKKTFVGRLYNVTKGVISNYQSQPRSDLYPDL